MADVVCEPSEILVFACSGKANVGQIANAVAVDLGKEGKASMFCLAGLGGHVPAIVEGTKKAKKIVVVDGCSLGCAKRIVVDNGFDIDEYVLVAGSGIDKSAKGSDFTDEEKEKIKALIEERICVHSSGS